MTPADLKPNSKQALFIRAFPARGRTAGDHSKHMEEEEDVESIYTT